MTVGQHLSDREAEALAGGQGSALERWLRQALPMREWQSFWSLFQILARSAWVSLTRAPGS